jgi:plastocyanin
MEQRVARQGSRLVWLAAGLVGIVAALLLAVPTHAAVQKRAHIQSVERLTLVIKSDSEHGKKGPDGKFHDTFLPANFTVHKGAKVVVTVLNYDDMPHSLTASALHVNAFFMMGMAGKPSRTTFTCKAEKTGNFAWHCNPKCDAWSMAHWGFMKGYIKVIA